MLQCNRELSVFFICHVIAGNIADVAGTKFDLTKETDFGKRLLEVPGKVGFDHAFCLESPGWYKHAARYSKYFSQKQQKNK